MATTLHLPVAGSSNRFRLGLRLLAGVRVLARLRLLDRLRRGDAATAAQYLGQVPGVVMLGRGRVPGARSGSGQNERVIRSARVGDARDSFLAVQGDPVYVLAL
jgi:hypothetical protein